MSGEETNSKKTEEINCLKKKKKTVRMTGN